MGRAKGSPVSRRWTLASADSLGAFQPEKGWEAAVRTGGVVRRALPEELIELPPGSRVQFLPDRAPLGWPRGADEPVPFPGALAVAAQLPSGYTRTLLPALERPEGASFLPFFGYTAVAFRAGKLYAAALQTDANPHWQPESYATPDLDGLIKARLAQEPENRVLRQLEVCARDYGCYNAQNIFYGRWEGAVPVSPACNAVCVGCISEQPDDLPPSPQQRFRFVPSLEEIVDVGLRHLRGPDSIYSFGQGCEGEPLLQADLIARSVKSLRSQTSVGTLHLNSNASLPEGLARICEAGLDSLRVSLNSVVASRYEAYYQPRRYKFAQVEESVRVARSHGVSVSLNLLHMPGWNDSPEDLDTLLEFLTKHGVAMVQMRNLNIDPDLYSRHVPPPPGPARGIPALVEGIRSVGVRVGNHTLPLVR